MKIFIKKGVLQKIIIVVLTVLLLNFILPTYSQASFGGVLAGPLIDLLASIGDAALGLLQSCMGYSTGASVEFSTNPLMIDKEDLGSYSDINASGESPTTDTIKKEDLDLGWFGLSNTYSIPIVTYSPEQIFSGQVPGLDINFINPNKYVDGDGNSVDSAAKTLQPIIAQWYVALRNLAIVGLMCVLVYVGIRILLSSTAADKAKYKQLFTDWLIALCLLFFLHYIMSFTLTMVDAINDSLNADPTGNIIVQVDDGTTFKTNLIGLVRFKTQYADFFPRLQYLIVYLFLVGYTVMFTWTYLKRLLNMAFLTIIAPLVALTYPIDKISDGQAQAFNSWLKEFVYNALLQPFHYIIYIVLIGSAESLVQKNFIYALAALGFIMAAEKILRNIFGFNKAGAGTVGALGGFTGGALAAQLLNSAKSAGKAAKGGKGPGGKENNNSPELPGRVRDHDTSDLDFAGVNSLPDTTGSASGTNDEATQNGADNSNNGNNDAYEDFQDDIRTHNNGEDLDENLSPEEMAAQDPNYMYMHPELFADNNTGADEQQNDAGTQEELNGNNEEGAPEADNTPPTEEQPKINGFQRLYNRHFATKKGGLGGAVLRQSGKLARTGLRTAGTIAGVSAGAIAGVASGKGLSGMVTGAVAGAAVGRGIGDKVGEVPGAVGNRLGRAGRGIQSEWATFRGTEAQYNEKQFVKQLKSEDNRKLIADKIYRDTGRRATKQEVDDKIDSLKDYAREGMTDVNEMMRAQKAEKYGVSSEQSAKIAMIAKERGITADLLNDEKKYKARLEDMTQEWEDRGLSHEEASRNASYTLNVMKAQNGQRNNLNRMISQPNTSTQNSTSRTRTRNNTNNNG